MIGLKSDKTRRLPVGGATVAVPVAETRLASKFPLSA